MVGEAVDGGGALVQTTHLQPDLIVLDLNMPHRDGLSVLTELYAAAPRTRVVVLTSYTLPAALHAALDLGAFRCLRKGIRRADLLAELLAVLESR